MCIWSYVVTIILWFFSNRLYMMIRSKKSPYSLTLYVVFVYLVVPTWYLNWIEWVYEWKSRIVRAKMRYSRVSLEPVDLSMVPLLDDFRTSCDCETLNIKRKLRICLGFVDLGHPLKSGQLCYPNEPWSVDPCISFLCWGIMSS